MVLEQFLNYILTLQWLKYDNKSQVLTISISPNMIYHKTVWKIFDFLFLSWFTP